LFAFNACADAVANTEPDTHTKTDADTHTYAGSNADADTGAHADTGSRCSNRAASATRRRDQRDELHDSRVRIAKQFRRCAGVSRFVWRGQLRCK
jgi:hypothetical protein